VHPFAVLGDPVRRRIVELLAEGELSSGEVVNVVGAEFGITQSAVSQQLKVLRDAGFAKVRAEGRRRLYALDPGPLRTIDEWLAHYRVFWASALEDLAAEVERGKAERAAAGGPVS
jgi:DNA-binding transcriptional ArsR family regulator